MSGVSLLKMTRLINATYYNKALCVKGSSFVLVFSIFLSLLLGLRLLDSLINSKFSDLL